MAQQFCFEIYWPLSNVKYNWEIFFQIFVAFSEYMNFMKLQYRAWNILPAGLWYFTVDQEH